MQQDFVEIFLTRIGTFTDLLAQIETTVEELTEQISKVDLEQQNILHEIEKVDFNAYQGFLLSKRLQEVRRRRRLVKNQWEIARAFRDIFANNNKTLHVSLYKALTKLRKIKELQAIRTYTPKEIDYDTAIKEQSVDS